MQDAPHNSERGSSQPALRARLVRAEAEDVEWPILRECKRDYRAAVTAAAIAEYKILDKAKPPTPAVAKAALRQSGPALDAARARLVALETSGTIADFIDAAVRVGLAETIHQINLNACAGGKLRGTVTDGYVRTKKTLRVDGVKVPVVRRV